VIFFDYGYTQLMGNSLTNYKERIAGLSPKNIRVAALDFSIQSWKGVALESVWGPVDGPDIL